MRSGQRSAPNGSGVSGELCEWLISERSIVRCGRRNPAQDRTSPRWISAAMISHYSSRRRASQRGTGESILVSTLHQGWRLSNSGFMAWKSNRRASCKISEIAVFGVEGVGALAGWKQAHSLLDDGSSTTSHLGNGERTCPEQPYHSIG